MNGHDVSEITASTLRGACLVEGCSCKDARIVSTRRASYFASVAKARGETAERVVDADPNWVLRLWSEADLANLDAAA